jgi:hypothetical protein
MQYVLCFYAADAFLLCSLPLPVIEKMRGVLVSMKKSAPGGDEQFKAAVNTLMKYIGNIARAPEEEKFRSIKSSNAAFQQRVAVVPGSIDFLHLCGFEVRIRDFWAGFVHADGKLWRSGDVAWL